MITSCSIIAVFVLH